MASGASGSLHFEDGQLQSQQTTRELWHHHGLNEYYHPDGRTESTTLSLNGEDLLRQDYHANGQLMARETHQGQDVFETRWWPSGQLNTESIDPKGQGAPRYLRCLDEAGKDLAPGGNGRFVQTIGDGGRREGTLKNGLLEGEMTWIDAKGQTTGSAHFRDGSESL